MFDINLFSITLIEDGKAPVDITPGLVVEGNFYKLEKEQKEDTNVRLGARQTAYTAVNSDNKSRILNIKYLPDSNAVKILNRIKKNNSKFGLAIVNASDPKYYANGSNCTIVEVPADEISQKTGFSDYEYKIRIVDCDTDFPDA